MISYSCLNLHTVLYIHEEIINHSGGKHGIRDFTLLHSALERCRATFNHQDLFLTLHQKAAALLHSMTMNHPFLDGNKRTAFAMFIALINENGFDVTADADDIIRFCISVANDRVTQKEITTWIEKNTTRV